MKEVFAEILSNLNVDEVLDCGIGEATSWLRQGRDAVEMVRGFDVSLSRLSYADANLTSLGVSYALFSADLHDIPVTSNGGGSRSEERRVGKEGVGGGRARGGACHIKKKNRINISRKEK